MQTEENPSLKDSSDNKSSETFDKYPLKPALLSGLQESGYMNPFPLQQRALKPLLQGKDVLIESSCASGKTIAVIIAALQFIDTEDNDCQALVLAPTREICRQTMEFVEKIGKNMKINALSIIGGVPFEAQKQKLREGVSLVLGTPGRVYDLIQNGDFKLEKLKLVVLDESNYLLDIGFKNELKSIFKFVPMDVQFCMISSWYAPTVQKMAEFCLKEPVCVNMCPRSVDMKSVDHFKVKLEKHEEKVDLLKDLFANLGSRKSVIFCKKREDRENIVQVLREKGLNAWNLDSNTSEVEMSHVMGIFGSGHETQQLVVTEDPEIFIQHNCTPSNASLIISYDLPKSEKDYQRSFGIPPRFFTRKQSAISIASEGDLEVLKEIESLYSIEFKELPKDLSNF